MENDKVHSDVIHPAVIIKDLLLCLVLRGYNIKSKTTDIKNYKSFSQTNLNESHPIVAINDPFRIHLYCKNENAIIEIYKVSKSYNQLDFDMELLVKSVITTSMITHILFILEVAKNIYMGNNPTYNYQIYFKQLFLVINANIIE